MGRLSTPVPAPARPQSLQSASVYPDGRDQQIRASVRSMLAVAQDRYATIDSLPVPGGYLPSGAAACARDASEATCGRCSFKRQVFFGYRLHLVLALGRVILDFVLTRATGDERAVAADLLQDQPGRIVLGDKGYFSTPLAEVLAAHGGAAAGGAAAQSARPLAAHADPPGHPLRYINLHLQGISVSISGSSQKTLSYHRSLHQSRYEFC